MDFPLLIFQLIVLIFSVMIHEIAHGYIAERLGDPTARLAGRLTLNPIKHLDPVGSIFLPLLLLFTGAKIVIGWAKPVPYNPNNLHKDFKYGPLKVALAGPASNLLIVLIIGLIARIFSGVLDSTTIGLLGFTALINAYLAIFNLVPIPPLDGSKLLTIFLPPRYGRMVEQVGFFGIFIIYGLLFAFSGVISQIAGFIFGIVAGPDVFLKTISLWG
jgi:Zn-dependent protease